MDRRNLLKLGGLTAAATLCGFEHAAVAQQKMVLKATDVHPLGYPTVEAVVRMGKKLENATNGRTQHPDVSVDAARRREGNDRAGAGRRAADRTHQVGPMGPVVDELNVFNLPFMFRDERAHAEGDRRPMSAARCSRSSPIIRPPAWSACAGWTAARAMSTTARPVKTVADLKGLKIRMMGNPVFVDTMNAMGGNGVAMGYNQLVSALQSGVVDGAENNEPTLRDRPALPLCQGTTRAPAT